MKRRTLARRLWPVALAISVSLMVFGFISPNKASAATPNPTCGTNGARQGCVTATASSLVFSFSGYGQAAPGFEHVETASFKNVATGQSYAPPPFGWATDSASFPVSVPDGEYSGMVSVSNDTGQYVPVDFDLVVGSPPPPPPSATLTATCKNVAVATSNASAPSAVVYDLRTGASYNVPVNNPAGATVPDDWYTAYVTNQGKAVSTTIHDPGYAPQGDYFYVGCGEPEPARPSQGGFGYWLVAKDGGIFTFGDATFHGSTGNIRLNQPIVGMAADPATGGYWFVAADGGVFSFDAPFYGSTGSIHLNKPVVGMAATPDGKGYWLVASDGGIFSFGDARFYGSTGGIRLNQPIVGMAATPSGHGYWLVASDGGIFTFGDARFYGSTGSIRLNQPVVGMASTLSGDGYWLVARDGGIFSFGNARFYGSTGNIRLNQPIVGMAADPATGGYWFVASDGGIFSFNAPFFGSMGGTRLNQPVVGMAAG